MEQETERESLHSSIKLSFVTHVRAFIEVTRFEPQFIEYSDPVVGVLACTSQKALKCKAIFRGHRRESRKKQRWIVPFGETG